MHLAIYTMGECTKHEYSTCHILSFGPDLPESFEMYSCSQSPQLCVPYGGSRDETACVKRFLVLLTQLVVPWHAMSHNLYSDWLSCFLTAESASLHWLSCFLTAESASLLDSLKLIWDLDSTITVSLDIDLGPISTTTVSLDIIDLGPI